MLGNNSASASLPTDRIADLGVTLTSNVTLVEPQAAIRLAATASNAGPNPSSDDTKVVIELGAGLAYQSAEPSRGTCDQVGDKITCTLGSLAAAGEATIVVTAMASTTGQLTPAAQISAGEGLDLVAANNPATALITSRLPPAPPPPPSGGGGGGAGSFVELLLALAWAQVVARSGAACRRVQPKRRRTLRGFHTACRATRRKA